jgi:hypothetical protein
MMVAFQPEFAVDVEPGVNFIELSGLAGALSALPSLWSPKNCKTAIAMNGKEAMITATKP